jgi:two-component system, NarL family, sensor histidine kinase DegS
MDLYYLPASELINIYENETPRRLRSTTYLNTQTSPSFWSVNGMPLDVHESRVLIRTLFKDLVLKTSGELQASFQSVSPQVNLSGDKMSQILHDLAMEKQNLVQKIVIQQEEVQKRIARDLHDTVISDVMMLKRSLAEQSMDKTKVIDTLDSINEKLREICHDLAPRDLIDWGLQPVIEDLLQKIAEQTGADCSFSCDCQLPELSESVQLHIFRIIQECLNNSVKYSEATRIQVRVDRIPGQLSFIIEDNGKGFNQDDGDKTQSTKDGGFGLGGMHERIDLIRCFYPARLAIESQPGAGTRTSIVLAIG